MFLKAYPYLNPSSPWYYPLHWLLLIILGLGIYYQTFGFGFVFDDNIFIVDNPYIKNLNNLQHVWRGSEDTLSKTRFVGIYSFAFNYLINQLNPIGYHIFNFIVHLVAVGLVWGLANLLLKVAKWTPSSDLLHQEFAFIVAIFFLVHPCQTQAITYITQRFESIATVFYLGSVYCYLRARLASINTHKILLLGGAGILALLGLLTKEVIITLPLMILAIEIIFFHKNIGSLKKFFQNTNALKFSFFLIVGGILFYLLFMKLLRIDHITSILNYRTPSESHDGDLVTFGNYFLTQMRVFLTFLGLLILPISQNLDYDYPLSTSLLNPPTTLLGACVFIFIIFLIIKLRKNFSLAAFGLAWMLITFSINMAPRANVIFEHKLYLISFGFLFVFVYALSTIIRHPKLLAGIFLLLIALLSITSFTRNQVWKNELTLWQDTIKKSPNKQRVIANLGRIYISYKEYDKAIHLLTIATQKKPADFKSYVNRGIAYEAMGNDVKAMEDFNKAMDINPKHFLPYLRRSKVYIKQNNMEAAFADLDKAVSLSLKFQYAYVERGYLLLQQNHINEALNDFNKALNIAPSDLDALNGRATIYAMTNQIPEAIKDFTKALSIDPTNAVLYKNRAFCLLSIGNRQAAKEDLQKSIRYNPNDSEVQSILYQF